MASLLNEMTWTCFFFVLCVLHSPISATVPMPPGNKMSKVAKNKRNDSQVAFTTQEERPESPESSEYCPTDGASESDVEPSVEALQKVYSVFLPPNLCHKERTWEKRRKVSNRSAVYTRDSRTTIWRKNAALREAAKGCQTLDAFVKRTVCL
jgi:hypothetical protein